MNKWIKAIGVYCHSHSGYWSNVMLHEASCDCQEQNNTVCVPNEPISYQLATEQTIIAWRCNVFFFSNSSVCTQRLLELALACIPLFGHLFARLPSVTALSWSGLLWILKQEETQGPKGNPYRHDWGSSYGYDTTQFEVTHHQNETCDATVVRDKARLPAWHVWSWVWMAASLWWKLSSIWDGREDGFPWHRAQNAHQLRGFGQMWGNSGA